MQDKDPNIMPEIKLFHPVRATLRLVGRFTSHCALDPSNMHSTHLRGSDEPERGGAAALDRALYDGINQMTFFDDDPEAA